MTSNNIIGIYLAAGKSERMGRNKLILPAGADYVGIAALRTALSSKLNKIIVVMNAFNYSFFNKKLPQNEHEKLVYTICASAGKGLSSSLKHGIHKAETLFNPDGVFILLADQPFVTEEMINKLIDVFYERKSFSYIASCYNNVIRPPLIIHKRIFPSLDQLKGDKGAKYLFGNQKCFQGETIEFYEEKLFFDVDTKEEYEFLMSEYIH
ncbi:nucleotidyltransferase family protein [Metabacillus fastidiosus]|uniref:nucleotidyltransferase family protein n=1 Tax=Metabacillus fastidiosus TaxID=1458 RepID=UPI002E1C33FC|nr:nucleotidyltransferase family protein [Metabacillus fastidiosus]